VYLFNTNLKNFQYRAAAPFFICIGKECVKTTAGLLKVVYITLDVLATAKTGQDDAC
jgi:hypothetical protein